MFKLSTATNGRAKFTVSENGNTYGIVISDRFTDVEKFWDEKMGGLYLHPAYLTALEQAPPYGLDLLFLQFYEDSTLIGQACFQALSIKGKDHYQPEEQASMCKYGFFYSLMDFVRRKIINRTKLNILVAGNLMNVGTNFYAFHQAISEERQLILLGKGIKRSILFLKEERGKKFDTSLIKEFDERDQTAHEVFKGHKYHRFSVEPNMQLEMKWQSFEEYLKAMSSKYRVRQRRARKKLKGLTVRELQPEELEQLKEEMHQLYLAIANNAQLNLVNVDPNYHLTLKRHLGDRIHIRGYFKEDQLVGFFTLLHNEDTIDAGYLGIQTEENRKHQIYLNMLYDMVAYGIKHKIKKLVFARTALEIKSSVGAVPEKKFLFLRHQNTLWHQLSKEFLKVFNTPPEWKQRHPFKD